jgi:hypothetical membrane protein
MARDARLLFGPLAALILAIGIVVLGLLVPGYSATRQTVSEIGEMASPMRWPFTALLLILALCLLVFTSGVWRASRRAGRNITSVICLAWMAIAVAALGVLAFPHPLHGIFGLSQMIGYQAPLAFALAWRGEPRMRQAAAFSMLMYVLLLLSTAVNLSTVARDSGLWNAIQPFYGLVQRSLFVCFFGWVAGAGWMLWRGAGLEQRSSA